MSAPFAAKERVLCYHGPLIYEAKVLEVKHFEGTDGPSGQPGWGFYVHYKGWKQKWDEWVDESRVLKYAEEGLARQRDAASSAKPATSAAGGAAKAKAVASASAAGASTARGAKAATRGTKRGRDDDEGVRKPEMKLAMPDALKHLLVDDWEAVTKNQQLVPLPRTPNVAEILAEWKAHVLADPASHPSLKDPVLLLPTVTAGLQTYFDRALGANLLYRFERPQYGEIRKQYVSGPHIQYGQEREMSAVYGAEHLVRLIVSMPAIVQHSSMDSESSGIVRDYVNELMVWMVAEKERLFLPEYDAASSQYQNIARGG